MVIVNEATRAALIADGWTPPARRPEPEAPTCGTPYGYGTSVYVQATRYDAMHCQAPEGHTLDPRDTDTWHRNGAVRWTGVFT